jgi:hypothetical protein
MDKEYCECKEPTEHSYNPERCGTCNKPTPIKPPDERRVDVLQKKVILRGLLEGLCDKCDRLGSEKGQGQFIDETYEAILNLFPALLPKEARIEIDYEGVSVFTQEAQEFLKRIEELRKKYNFPKKEP